MNQWNLVIVNFKHVFQNTLSLTEKGKEKGMSKIELSLEEALIYESS